MGKFNKEAFRFPKAFWISNVIELFERWAWYGFFILFANYLTGSSDVGGLEFTQSQKGAIMGIGTGILYFLPIITGAIADKYGYKKMLTLAFIIYASAFFLFPLFDSFTGVFIAYIYLAVGAALFKPIISAMIAKTTNDKNASLGFGIFYMMVNLGAFFGPLLTLLYKDNPTMIFNISAGIICVNFILLLFFEEPDREKNDDTLGQSIVSIFKNIGSVLKDFKFVAFLLIISGFWTMYNQLFFTLPVFITQWVDTSSLYHFFHESVPFITSNYAVPGKEEIEAEFIINMDALFIIGFQLLVSSFVMKFKPLRAMMSGFFVCTIGMALTVFTQNVTFTIVAIFIFALGEMSSSPKITEYIGRIAPTEKKALYMGYSFIPIFLGNIFAGYISGGVYEKLSDKQSFVLREAELNSIRIPDGLSQNETLEFVATRLNLSTADFTDYLWKIYDPSSIWIVILGIGALSVVLLYFYDLLLIRKKS